MKITSSNSNNNNSSLTLTSVGSLTLQIRLVPAPTHLSRYPVDLHSLDGLGFLKLMVTLYSKLICFQNYVQSHLSLAASKRQVFLLSSAWYQN